MVAAPREVLAEKEKKYEENGKMGKLNEKNEKKKGSDIGMKNETVKENER